MFSATLTPTEAIEATRAATEALIVLQCHTVKNNRAVFHIDTAAVYNKELGRRADRYVIRKSAFDFIFEFYHAPRYKGVTK